MKQQTRQLSLALPRVMDDTTVLELWHFLNSLAKAFDLKYGQQVRRAFLNQLPDPAPQQLWLPFMDNGSDSVSDPF